MKNNTNNSTTNTAIITNAMAITALTKECITVKTVNDDMHQLVITVDNKLANITVSALTDDEKTAYIAKVKSLAHSIIEFAHASTFKDNTFNGIANSLYDVSFTPENGTTEHFKHVALAINTMSKEASSDYKTACEALQLYFAEMLNASTNNAVKPETALKVKKLVKKSTQDVVTLFRNNSGENAMNVYINERDMDVLRSAILKCSNREFKTVGNTAVMGILETMLYHKLNSMSYFISLSGVSKEKNGVAPKPEKETVKIEKKTETTAA